MQITLEQIEKYEKILDNMLRLGSTLARITPTEFDDKAFQKTAEIKAIVMPFLKEQWAIDLINLALEFFEKKEVQDIVEQLKKVDSKTAGEIILRLQNLV